jgi:hypothetical protein
MLAVPFNIILDKVNSNDSIHYYVKYCISMQYKFGVLYSKKIKYTE